MEKLVIIINGRGGAGKDTLCSFASQEYRVMNVSAIEPIKEIARKAGWNGEKDAKSRKMLSDLKQLFIDYNDLPTQYLYERFLEFVESENEIMFVHIREGKEIDKLKSRLSTRCITLLVERGNEEQDKVWGNASDDEVSLYPYDFIYRNDKSLDEAKEDFLVFLKNEIIK